ncbi:MAG: sulfatase, partial [Planctomycetota bacterium]
MPTPNLMRAIVVAAIASAVDAVATRLGHPHRPMGPELFLEGWALWLVPSLAAAVGLGLLATRLRWLREDSDGPLRWSALTTGAAAPVLMHAALDAFTSIGGDLSGLSSWKPWAAGVGLIGGTLLVALIVERALAKGPAALRPAILLATVAAGLFVPRGGPPQPDRPALDPGGAPNLLLMVWDTARAGSFSFLGGDRATTPALERLVDQSLLFDNARSVTHFTFTSHLSMLTGRYPSEHGARLVDTRHLPETGGETLAQELQRAGYRTGAFVGTGVLRANTGLAAGFDVYSDRVDPESTYGHLWALIHDLQSVLIPKGGPGWNNGEPHWIQDFQRSADGVLAEAATWIEEGGDAPWFCFVNMFDVHWPYTPSDAARDAFATAYEGPIGGYATRANDWPRGRGLDSSDDAHLESLYEAEFFDLDQQVGAFLEDLGLDASNTAVLITADHGEAFGEGGVYEHEDILEPQVTVPMILRLPGRSPRSGRSGVPVSGIDVAPTLRSLAGLDRRDDQYLGLDLTAEDLPSNRVVFVEDRDHYDADKAQFALYAGKWKLVWLDALRSDQFALYDLEADPVGAHDVSAEHPDVGADRVGFEVVQGKLIRAQGVEP